MAKGLKIPVNFAAFDRRVIVIDKSGVPWVIDPAEGSIRIATIDMDDKLPAVKKRK